ncbi:MAG: hypothetical protein D6819_07305 [Gammaproteobacteria bacterium]|nr:MAG: hypothetical protein D6819_07305 [Gammaproteobacteria bacterium]
MAKTIGLTDLGTLKNQLNKYRRGKKLTLPEFNQAARLAWLGKALLQPLDPDDPECRAFILYLEEPEGLAGSILHIDPQLLGRMHILDHEQGLALLEIIREGVEARAALYQELDQKDFYFKHFFRDGQTRC